MPTDLMAEMVDGNVENVGDTHILYVQTVGSTMRRIRKR